MKNFIKHIVHFFLIINVGLANAAPALDDPNSAATGFQIFVNNVNGALAGAIGSAAVQSDVNMLWAFFSVLLVIWTMYLYAFNKGTLVDLITAALLIMFVQAIMLGFDPLTTAIWLAANGFASDIQTSLLGTGDLFFAPTFITKIINSITFAPSSVFDLIGAFASAIDIAIVSAISIILSALAYFAVIWSFWGYAIAKLTGLLFVPFLLYERLSWLFDGWLRFFFGFCIYAIVARLNIALVALSLASFFGVTLGLGTPPPISAPALTSLTQVLSLLIFALVGILATLSTGSFVATIVGGSAQSTGVGRQLSRGAGALAAKFLGK